MGIQGLLPLLKSIHKPTHLRNFAGQTLGIDAYGWLHRGTVACAIELAQQKPTRKHIDFALSRVRMLLYFGVKPYMVFDGAYLPSKAHTETERAAKRQESKRAGLELLRMGRLPQAHLELQKAVDVTPSMARELIEELKLLNVPYIVAPYEADSQLAYLEKRGDISGVISEDSDLLVFGVKVLMTKLDQHGECVMIRRSDFTACCEVNLVGWSDHEFRMMAMLSGCDYLPGINNMGLKTAYRMVRKHKTIERIVRMVQFDGKMKVPPDYLESFARAERTFLYPWVYCAQALALVNLNPVPTHLTDEEMAYLGEPGTADEAKGVAKGDLDPNTKKRIAFASRPAPSAARMNSVHTPDLKQGKSITEFFKASRTPLSELDPNSFTPSSSQQRLLEEQRTTSWPASQAPATSIPAFSRVASRSAPVLARAAGRRTLSEQGPIGHRVSPKRQRLCSDSTFAQSMKGSVGLQSTASHFFAKTAAIKASPTRKASRQKQEEDFELWSDGSVADAVAEVAAAQAAAPTQPSPVPRKRKKLAVYADIVVDERNGSAPTDSASAGESQITTATITTITTAAQSPSETPLTSFESLGSQTQDTVFSKGIDATFESLKAGSTHRASTPKHGARRTKSAPFSSTVLVEKAERNVLLDRLAALSEFEDPATQIDEDRGPEAVVPCSSPIISPFTQAEDNEPENQQRHAIELRRASPHTHLYVMGSEDLLVPNSPSNEEHLAGLTPSLDFGRFAFTG